MSKINTTPNTQSTVKENDLFEAYLDQTVVEGKHDYHIDGYTYGDYSDSCCC